MVLTIVTLALLKLLLPGSLTFTSGILSSILLDEEVDKIKGETRHGNFFLNSSCVCIFVYYMSCFIKFVHIVFFLEQKQQQQEQQRQEQLQENQKLRRIM